MRIPRSVSGWPRPRTPIDTPIDPIPVLAISIALFALVVGGSAYLNRRRRSAVATYADSRGFTLVRPPMLLTSQAERWTRSDPPIEFAEVAGDFGFRTLQWQIEGRFGDAAFCLVAFDDGRRLLSAQIWETPEDFKGRLEADALQRALVGTRTPLSFVAGLLDSRKRVVLVALDTPRSDDQFDGFLSTGRAVMEKLVNA